MMEGRSILRYDCRRPKALSEFTATLTRTFSEAADNTSKLHSPPPSPHTHSVLGLKCFWSVRGWMEEDGVKE